jgi:serine/threonine protein kinase
MQVDLYAVGAIAYEFIYGRPPFYRRDRAEKKSLILKGKLVFTSAFSVQAQVRLPLVQLCADNCDRRCLRPQ